MGENTKIEWATHTFNPWIGCAKVSAGCMLCYAERDQDKRHGRVKWGELGTRVRTSPTYWKQPFKWNAEAEGAAERPRVFCASLADVFEIPRSAGLAAKLDYWRSELWPIIEATPNLDWLLLTKRPENIIRCVMERWTVDTFPKNIWLGTSVEDQASANVRIPTLLRVPATVRFLSCEPLLGPVDLFEAGAAELQPEVYLTNPPQPKARGKVSWVIVGGESGPGCRHMEPIWAMMLRDDCAAAGIPFFFKQLGGVRDKGGDLAKAPPYLRVREIPHGPRVS